MKSLLFKLSVIATLVGLTFSSLAIGIWRPVTHPYSESMSFSFNQSYLFQNPAFFDGSNKVDLTSYYIIPNSKSSNSTFFSSLNYQFKENWNGGMTVVHYKPYDSVRLRSLGLHLARQIQFSENTHLSAAVRLNINQLESKIEWWPTSEQMSIKNHQPDVDFGLWFRAKHFYSGLSIKHILSPNLSIPDSLSNRIPADLYPRHTNFNIGYDFTFFEKINFQPNFRYQATIGSFYNNFQRPYTHRINTSIGAWLGYNDLIYIGLFNISGEGLTLSARFRYKKKLSIIGSYREDIWSKRSYQFGINLAL